MSVLYRAALETMNFTFEAYGDSERSAIEAMRKGWKVHRKHYDARDEWADVKDDVQVIKVHTGLCYRDGEAEPLL